MKSKLSNLYACKLEQASSILIRNNFIVKTIETNPPDKKNGYGIKRVIAIKKINPKTVKIIWSYENYE